jgi:hypothetical protein
LNWLTSWHQDVWGQWTEREASSNNWTGNCEDTCLMWGDSEGEEEVCIARLQCLIFSSHLQGLVHCHLYCWTPDIMVQMTSLQFKRKWVPPAYTAICLSDCILFVVF